MKSDRTRHPVEGVIVMIQAVPPGIKRSAVTAQGSGRGTKLGRLTVLRHRESGSPGKLRGLVNVPITGARSGVAHGIDRTVLPVKTPLTRKPVGLGEHCVIDQPFGQVGIRSVQPPDRIDTQGARLFPVGGQRNERLVDVFLALGRGEIRVGSDLGARTHAPVFIPDVGNELIQREAPLF